MWYVANELGFIQSLSSHKQCHSALSVLCCAPVSTGLTFTRHCRAPIKCYRTQPFLPPNSVNTVRFPLLSFTLSADSSAGKSLRNRHPDLTVTPPLHPKQAMTIVSQYVHLLTRYMWQISWDGTKNSSSVPTVQWLWGNGSSCDPTVPATVILWDHGESKGRQTVAGRQKGYRGTLEALSSQNR